MVWLHLCVWLRVYDCACLDALVWLHVCDCTCVIARVWLHVYGVHVRGHQVAYTHYMSTAAALRDLGYTPRVSVQEALWRTSQRYVAGQSVRDTLTVLSRVASTRIVWSCRVAGAGTTARSAQLRDAR